MAAAIDGHAKFGYDAQSRKICVLHQIQCALISIIDTMKAYTDIPELILWGFR